MRTGLANMVRARFDQMRGRLVKTLGRLTPEDVAWRPNEASNSVANLVLHTCGMLNHWLLRGVGGVRQAAERDRDAEFTDRTARTPEDLVAMVESTFGAVDRLLSELPDERLDAPVEVRTETVSGAEVLVRMVAHAGEHVGQILYIAKTRMGNRFDALSTPARRPS